MLLCLVFAGEAHAAPRKHKKKKKTDTTTAPADANATGASTEAGATTATAPEPAPAPPPPKSPIAPPPPPPETISPSTPMTLTVSPGAPDMTKRWGVGLDIVVGFGHVTALNESPNVAIGTGTDTSKDDTKTTTDSYVLGADYWTTDNARLFLRLPIAHANFDAGGLRTRHGATALGDLELALAYWKPLTENTSITPSLAIALPTSSGNELPPAANVDTKAPVGSAYDRASALDAAAAARGFAENELFADKRLGIVPQVAAQARLAPRLELDPFLKMDNLVGVVGSLSHGYVGDFVGGGALAYKVADWLDVAIRAWVTWVFAGRPDLDSKVLAIAEPQLRGHFGVVSPTLGLLLPFVPPPTHDHEGPAPSSGIGPANDPTFDARFVALRFAATVRF